MIAAVLALLALTIHGANWVALKTSGELNARAKRVAGILWPLLAVLTLASLWATLSIRPEMLANYRRHAILLVIPAAVAASLVAMFVFARNRAEKAAFVASSAYLALMLLGAAAAVYPNLLISTTDPALNITVYNSASGTHSLSIGLIWWGFGMLLAIGYVVFVYRIFRGKVTETTEWTGY